MKKLIAGALVLALTAGAAKAQEPNHEKHGHKKENRMKQMDALNLTEDQKARLQAIREEQKKEMHALKNNSSTTKEQKKELHKKHREQMQAILTPDQRQQLDKIKVERKASWKRGDFKNRGNVDRSDKAFKRGGKFDAELGLTDEQKTKMATIRSSFKTQFEAIRNDKSLTDEQRKSKMQELVKSQKEQTRSVLTQEQIEKIEARKKARGSRNTR